MDSAGGFLANNCRAGRRKICISVAVLAVIIGCFLFAFTAFGSSPNSRNNLQQVAIVFRHGDKNPVNTYPNDPYLNYAWPDGRGALTKKGMLQLYKLGERLRGMYGSFIGDKYQTADIMVRSSYADRCIMSAQALLAAFYKPEPDDQFLPGLAWRPIPVYPIPRNTDRWIVAKATCPRLDKELNQAYANFSMNLNESMLSLYKDLSGYTGKEISSILDVEDIYNTLEIEVFNGLELPEWAKNYYNDRMKELAAKSLAIFTSNLVQRRLRGGPMLKDILDNMAMQRNGTDKHKLYLYSAHDLSQVNILRAMGFTDEILRPEYAAALIFELHTVNGGQDHEVKISYLNNTQSTEPHIISIPGCGEPCMLDTLFKIWEPVLPDDWEAECLT